MDVQRINVVPTVPAVFIYCVACIGFTLWFRYNSKQGVEPGTACVVPERFGEVGRTGPRDSPWILYEVWKGRTMSKLHVKLCGTAAMLIMACWPALAVEMRHGVLVGTVLKMDAAAKTVVVKAADGTEHTLRFLGRTTVHGATAVATAATDAFHGLKTGSEVAVTYTARGAKETAEEVDRIGKDGLKATEAMVTHIDRGAKTMTVKTAAGAEETYRLTDNAAKFAGKEVVAGAEKSAHVTVYYTEEASQKVAHFFKVAI